MTTPNIAEELEQIKLSLSENQKSGVDLLVDFIKRYGTKKELLFRVVLLKARYNRTENLAEKHEISEDLVKLSHDILKNSAHQFSNGKDIPEVNRAELESLRKKILPTGLGTELLIECEEVGKKFENTNFYLENINLEIKSGEITGLLGENGDGKTTLLKILAAEITSTEGSVKFYGKESSFITDWQSLKRNIAFLPQEIKPFNGTVTDHLRLSAALHGVRGENNEFEVEYVIHRIGIQDYKDAFSDDLSGGFKLRVAIASRLVWKPKILILDEPLGNLDVNSLNIFLTDLRNLAKSDTAPIAVVLSSQHITEVETIADRILLLSRGKLVHYGLMHEVGKDREINTFEIRTPLNKRALEDKLRDIPDIKLETTGFSYIITTPLTITLNDIMLKCVEAKIVVTSLVDLSNSTKKLLLQLNKAKNEY